MSMMAHMVQEDFAANIADYRIMLNSKRHIQHLNSLNCELVLAVRNAVFYGNVLNAD